MLWQIVANASSLTDFDPWLLPLSGSPEVVGSQDLYGFVGEGHSHVRAAPMSNHMLATLEVVEVNGILSCHGIV